MKRNIVTSFAIGLLCCLPTLTQAHAKKLYEPKLRYQPNSKNRFDASKYTMGNYARDIHPGILKQEIRKHMKSEQKAFYNLIKQIATDQELEVIDRIEKLLELAEVNISNPPKLRNIVLNSAALLAHRDLEEDERTETLKLIIEKAPHLQWMLNIRNNPNLLRLAEIQYSILIEDGAI